MRRPIVWALLYLAAGIIFGQYDMRIVLFCGGALFLLSVSLYGQIRYWPVFLFLLFALAGSLRVRDSLKTYIPDEQTLTTLSGEIIQTGVTASGNQKLILNADYTNPDNQISHTVLLNVYLKPDQQADIGQYVIVTGWLQPLEKQRNPGGYNEFLSQRSHKIQGKMFADQITVTGTHVKIVSVLRKCSNALAAVYDNALPPREAAVIKSVILGDKSELDEDIGELYRMAGIYHLLCISGLHVSILMMSVTKLLGSIMNKRTAGLVALAIMALYCIMTGASVSTVRAVTMCAVAVTGQLLFRDYDLIASTSFACILLLIYEPLYLYSAGFQLSFGAVFGIATLTKPVEHALTLTKWPLSVRTRNGLAANIAAVAATYPILSYHFYYLSTYSLLVNAVILPTASILVVFGLLIGLTGLVWPLAATFLSGIIFYLLRFYLFVCGFFTSLPFSVIQTGCCGLAVCLVAFGVLLAFAYAFSGYREILIKRLRWFAASIILLTVCLVVYRFEPGLTATVLDVGRSDCAVLRYHHYTFVIDGGNERTKSILDTCLDRFGVRQVDGIWVTDTTEARLTGVIALIEGNRVGALYIPFGLDMNAGLPCTLRAAADKTGTPIIRVNNGDTIVCGKLTITAQTATAEPTDSTDTMSLLVAFGQTKIQFARVAEGMSYGNADVIVCPYDASELDCSRWAGTVRPCTMVRSDFNSETLLENGMPVYSTYQSGAMLIKTNGKSLTVKPYSE